MFRPNTLLILGAASSKDFGFPLGDVLKGMIAKRLAVSLNEWNEPRFTEDNHFIFQSLWADAVHGLGRGRSFAVARMISSGVGLASSIDNFLEMRKTEPGIAICAKTAIASIILDLEQRCDPLLPEKIREYSSVNFDGRWHQQFAQICFEDVTSDTLADALSRVSVISFNYDRTFEQFVRVAMMQLYSLDWQKVSELSQHLRVTHPYGSLSPLPLSGRRPELEFGQDRITNFLPLAQQIKTFTEQVTEEDTLKTIENQVQNAETIVFLGFGFHKQNLDILEPDSNTTPKSVYGTAIGVAKTAQSILTTQLEKRFGLRDGGQVRQTATVRLETMDCSKLLEEYRLALQDK